MAVTLFRANKIIRPTKAEFTIYAVHADARYAQVGFLIKYSKMPDLTHVIVSFANDRLIRLEAGTFLLMTDRYSFHMKLIPTGEQDLADRKFW
ncbi:hypothetical protein [Paenibacillus luteus]|uniref:hypothetical protein n=1 Tax=Paenibacillus luteus TaxID=2545753 RepID=UPI0011417AF5|nr:hypothetical protein [Paenibacillus luteus]